MPAASSDRNLLFGVLALQMDFITQKALITAMNAWVFDKGKPLGEILRDQGALPQAEYELLDALVQKHLEKHDLDPVKSLASLSNVSDLFRQELRGLEDADLQASINRVVEARSASQPATARPPAEAARQQSGSAAGGDVEESLVEKPVGLWGAGRFRILRPHAKGGLGEVFVAEDTELHREVALKEIQAHHARDNPSRARFVLEAEITGGLEHPSIVPVYGLGTYADGRPFYAMRFIRGDSLKDAIERFHQNRLIPARRDRRPRAERASGPVVPGSGQDREAITTDSTSDKDAVACGLGLNEGEQMLEFRKLLGRFIDVCNAIGYAHSRGVLHRDLKPGNIMLGKYGETLVVDWGLAKAAGRQDIDPTSSEHTLRPASASGSSDLTVPGSAFGTPAYMSPEQARGDLDQLGPASDTFSLGATLYHVLTGQSPYGGKTRDDVMSKVIAAEFPSPRRVKPSVPAALEAVCLKAMASRPQDRYETPQKLAGDIEQWLADEPVTCYHEPPLLRARRWVKRHPTLVVTTAATVLVSLVSLAAIASIVGQSNRSLAAKNLELDAKNRQLDLSNTQLAQANTDLEAANASERVAKQDADQKRIAADKARDETKQAFDFLIKAFRKSDPSQDGETLTVASLFGQAAEQLETTFPNQPYIQAQLLSAMGETYAGLGLFQKAIGVLERAQNLFRQELGEEHEDTLASMNNLAYAHWSAKQMDNALPLFEQVLELRKTKLGPKHTNTLTSMNNLASAYHGVGRLAEALPLFEQSLEVMKTLLGPAHPNTLMSMDNLASIYASMGRMADALPLSERAVELMKSKLGPDHPTTLVSMSNLATIYESTGRLTEALQLSEQTLELRKAKLGPEHPSTLTSMQNLAHAYVSAGKLAEALPLLEQALQRSTAKLGPEHPSTLNTMNNLARAYLKSEQPEKSLPLFEQFIAGHRQRAKPDDPAFTDLLTELSLGLLQHGQYLAAETYLRECLTIREKTLPDDWVLFNTKSMLGGALAGQKKFQEAEPLLLAGYEGLNTRADKIPKNSAQRLPEAVQRLIDLYTAWEKPEQAAEWKKRLDALKPAPAKEADKKENE